MQNIVGEATGVTLNHLCYFFNKNFVGNKKYIFSRIDALKNVLIPLINRL